MGPYTRPSSSDSRPRRVAVGLLLAALLASGAVAGAAAQPRARGNAILSSQVALSRDEASLVIELADGGTLALALRNGRVSVNDADLGAYRRGGPLDASWRELLESAMDASNDRLAALLVEWSAPAGSEPGRRLDQALEDALGRLAAAEPGGAVRVAAASPAAPPSPAAPASPLAPASPRADTIDLLNERIAELEREVAELERRHEARHASWDLGDQIDREVSREIREGLRRRGAPGFFARVGIGVGKLMSLLLTYAVLVGLGFATVFFGRRYLEGVADTARHATLRSGIVGVATLFLLVPAFILGALALAISIVGIPALVLWFPLFPAAATAALVFGYLGVAHAGGEALAERRFYGGDWFKRANSYYYVLTGVGLLLALFAASFVVEIGGPWLDLLHGLLMFLAIVLTVAVTAIGLGAVLISRAGTRPIRAPQLEEPLATAPPVEEETDV